MSKFSFRKLLSAIIRTPIDKGYSITCDTDIAVKNIDNLPNMEKPYSKLSAKYNQKSVNGEFEFVSIVKYGNSDKVFYKLSHVASREDIIINKDGFTLLFQINSK